MPTFSISGKNVSAKTANSALKKHLLSLSTANAKKFEGQKVTVINKDSNTEKIILVSVVKELSKPKNVSVEGKRLKSAVDIKLKNWATKRKRANTQKSTKKTAKKAKKAGKTKTVVRINPGRPLENITNLSNASVLQNPQLGQQLIAPKIGNPILGTNNKALRNLGAFHDQYDQRRSLPPSADPVNTKSATIVRSDPVNTAKFQNDLRKLQDANSKLKDTKNQLEVELKQERQNSSEYKKDAYISKNLISDINERLSGAKTALEATERALVANPNSDALIGMIAELKNSIKAIENAKKQIERGNFDPQINDSLNAAQITGLQTEKKELEEEIKAHGILIKEKEQEILKKEKDYEQAILRIEKDYKEKVEKYKKEEDAINEQKLENEKKIKSFRSRGDLNKNEEVEYLKHLNFRELLNKKWTVLVKEQKDLSNKKISAESRSKDLEEQVKKLNAEKNSLEEEFKKTKSEKENLAKNLTRIIKEKEKYQASLSTSQTNEASLQEQKKGLQEQKKGLEDTIKNLEQEREQLNKRVADSEQGQDLLDRLDEYILFLKKERDVKTAEAADLSIDDKEKKTTQLNEAIKVYEAIRRNELSQASNIIINYSEAQEKIKNLESQIKNKKSEDNEAIENLKSQIKDLQSENEKRQNFIEQVTKNKQSALEFLDRELRVTQFTENQTGEIPEFKEENNDLSLLRKIVAGGDLLKLTEFTREKQKNQTYAAVNNRVSQNNLQNQVVDLSNLAGVQQQAGLQLEGNVANLEGQIVLLNTNKRELEREIHKLHQDREQLQQFVDSYDTNPLNSKKRKHNQVAPANPVENKNVRLQDENANLRQVNRELRLRLQLAKRTQKKPNLKNRITFINKLENKNESKDAIEKEIANSGESGGALEAAKSEGENLPQQITTISASNSENHPEAMEDGNSEVANPEAMEVTNSEVANPEDLMTVDTNNNLT